MKLSQKLHKATLVKRYKRFLADVIMEDGKRETIYCPNTGSMESCGQQGDTIYLSHHPTSQRKHPFTWEFTETKLGLIGINTSLPNAVVAEQINQGAVRELDGYTSLRREVRYGKNSRIDILLESKEKPKCYVEVKNVTLRRHQAILFPDAVTKRGTKHLRELLEVVQNGNRAVMFYFVNRPDGDYFSVAAQIDPDYAEALYEAMDRGVEVLAYRVASSESQMKLAGPMEVRL